MTANAWNFVSQPSPPTPKNCILLSVPIQIPMEKPLVLLYQTRLGEELGEEKWRQLFHKIPPSQRGKITRYLQWQDRQRALFGKLLTWHIFEDLGLCGSALQMVQHTEFHRPFLPGELDFNLSHAGDLVVCAASFGTRLGVDVEVIKQVDLDSFSLVLTPGQQEMIRKAENPLAAFFRIWTLKESVVKANGKGLTIPLNDLETDFATMRVADEVWHLHELQLDPRHKGFLATEVRDIDLQTKSFSFH